MDSSTRELSDDPAAPAPAPQGAAAHGLSAPGPTEREVLRGGTGEAAGDRAADWQELGLWSRLCRLVSGTSRGPAGGQATARRGSVTAPGAAELAAVFSADAETSRFVFVFPAFRMGLKRECYQRARSESWLQVPKGTYHYRGVTSALTAFGAAKGLIAVLGQLFDADELQSRLVFTTDDETESLLRFGGYTHYVLLGTRSHRYLSQVLTQYSDDFEFRFEPDDWSVIDKRERRTYTVPDPTQSSSEPPSSGMDYALIEKVVDQVSGRVILVIGGMWDTGTLAAGTFLVEHRKEIFGRFGSGGFQYLLEVVPGSTRIRRIVLARGPRRE